MDKEPNYDPRRVGGRLNIPLASENLGFVGCASCPHLQLRSYPETPFCDALELCSWRANRPKQKFVRDDLVWKGALVGEDASLVREVKPDDVGCYDTMQELLAKGLRWTVAKEFDQEESAVGQDKADSWDGVVGYCCATCRFYAPKDMALGMGRCRRRAPTLDGFPVVYQSEDWCGDHKIGTNPTKSRIMKNV